MKYIKVLRCNGKELKLIKLGLKHLKNECDKEFKIMVEHQLLDENEKQELTIKIRRLNKMLNDLNID